MTQVTVQTNLQLETPNKQETKHYIIIGAGGTGGYVIPQLARMVSVAAIGSVKLNPDTITIIDADIVEDKNLTRQNFIPKDLGKNKAEIMATRYSKSFGIDIRYIPNYIDNVTSLVEYMDSFPKKEAHFVIVDCTDNNKTRLLLHHVVESYVQKNKGSNQEVFYISSGNEEKAGQVVLSVKYTYDSKSISELFNSVDFLSSIEKTFKFELPDICEIFPDMELDKLPDELSCAEHSISAPQNIHTNFTAANIQIGFLNKIINQLPISQFMTFFDIESSVHKVLFNNQDDMTQAFGYVANNALYAKYLKSSTFDISSKDSVLIPTEAYMEEVKQKELKELEKKAKKEAKALIA